MSDTFNITATWDHDQYVAGDDVVGAIAGTCTHVEEVSDDYVIGPVTLPVVTPAGAQTTIDIGPVTVTRSKTVTTEDDVVIDTSRPIIDNGPEPKNWVVLPGLKSITAVA